MPHRNLSTEPHSPARAVYDPKISLGTIVETITLLLAAGSAYVALTTTDAKHDEQIKALTVEVARVDANHKALQMDLKIDIKEIKESVTAIRLQQAATSGQLRR